MKIIDLLNKIANKEDVPKKIKYNGCIYELHNRVRHFYNYKNNKGVYFEDEWFLTNILNDEIEIIEDTPKEDKKIEKVNKGCIAGDNLRNIDWHILDKLDEIIDRLNGKNNE